jgi:CDP-diacylglycerol--glycerol-3-phosphate 3-phosphatidyltransferase
MANLITIARFPLLILIILLLYMPSPVARLISVALLGLLIGMDSLDGLVARARNEVSLLGSVLDIMADRSVEQVMWVVYAHLGLVSVAVPIIFILRGIIVDALRSVHVGEGQTPFTATQTRIGSWIVGSPWMRSSYGIVKLFAFAGLALTHALMAYVSRGTVAEGSANIVWMVFRILSWIAVAFCITRGLPVIVESFAWLQAKSRPPRAQGDS